MSTSYHPQDPITSIKGVGQSSLDRLSNLGISTVADLIKHFPSRYYDYSEPVPINRLQVDKTQSLVATIGKVTSFFSKNGKLYSQATATDNSGKITLTWFNNPYIKRTIKENSTYTIAGKVSFWGKGLTIVSPVIEEGSEPSINTSGFVPVYPQTEGISSKWLRTKISFLLLELNLPDQIDPKIIESLDLMTKIDAYKNIHFPSSKEKRYKADKRLSFNEHLRININNQIELKNSGDSVKIKIDENITQKTRDLLPFTLTPDQVKTVDSIYKDLQTLEFTHRLIQGDTGSGKTATIIFGANQCLENRTSFAIMAPTEILARQHYKTFVSSSHKPDQVQLITATSKDNPILDKPMIYVGTHSLLTRLPQKMKYPLALVAIDEQHKFGVQQRNQLTDRTPVPHLLNLSATPIPRTVALGLLGDIKISNIKHKPKNRLPTKTHVISPTRFKNSPKWLREQLDSGNHIFVVCPNIQDHGAGIASVEKITSLYQKILENRYPVHSLHGKLKNDEQNAIISLFKEQGGVLVSTSLIEVGIDIPSANVMVIHSAERFGLASLHQLRGRVGRGDGQGYCLLVPSIDDEEETERLQLLKKYNSGLVLAQKDLRLRGSGEVFGTKQHGQLPTRLKYFWSKKLFLKAKQIAKDIVATDNAKAKQIASELETC